VASCPTCGAKLPRASKYCPQCGRPTEAGDTKVLDVPADETGQVPVSYDRAEPRYYGVTPATLALVLALLALVAAIVLFATGHWPFGLILIGVAVLFGLVYLEAARRKPGGALRARAGAAADSLATRGRVTRRVLALRRELQRLALVRTRLLVDLGDAVYRGDEQATETAREQVKELDRAAAEREAEMQTVLVEAQERLQQRRLEVQPTQMVEVPEEPQAPGEGDPGPVRIPEPYPPPDEGSPPQPAVIPEPGPLAPEENQSR
jgi:zinc ribbon protein